MKFLPMLAGFIAFAACACKPPPSPPPAPEPLTGQVFTIRADGLNLPLGGIEVSWVPAKELESEMLHLRERQAQVVALTGYEAQLDRIGSALERIRAAEGDRPLMERFLTTADWRLRKCRFAIAENPEIATLLESSRFVSAYPEWFEGSGFEQAAGLKPTLVEVFVSRLETLRETMATTDADGRFSLVPPRRETGYLLVHARTTALDRTQHDFWMMEVAPTPEGDLILSPRNRLSPGSFRKKWEVGTEDEHGTVDVSAFGLPDPSPLAAALSSYDEIAANREQRQYLQSRVEALRAELRQLVPPDGE